MIWLIALRNLLKNGHRSFITIISIGIGGLAMMLFGGFVTSVFFGVQTGRRLKAVRGRMFGRKKTCASAQAGAR